MEWRILSMLGLTLIAAGWFIQFRAVTPKKHELTPAFPMLNAVGIILLIVDSLSINQLDLAIFNGLTLAGAVLVFLSLHWTGAPAGRKRK